VCSGYCFNTCVLVPLCSYLPILAGPRKVVQVLQVHEGGGAKEGLSQAAVAAVAVAVAGLGYTNICVSNEI